MIDAVKDIIVALIENKQIANNSTVDENIKEVQTAIKEIGKTLHEISCSKFNN